MIDQQAAKPFQVICWYFDHSQLRFRATSKQYFIPVGMQNAEDRYPRDVSAAHQRHSD